jgi:hypothetical protein
MVQSTHPYPLPQMNRDKLKLIVRNMRSLLEALESEVFNEKPQYLPQEGEHLTISYEDDED